MASHPASDDVQFIAGCAVSAELLEGVDSEQLAVLEDWVVQARATLSEIALSPSVYEALQQQQVEATCALARQCVSIAAAVDWGPCDPQDSASGAVTSTGGFGLRVAEMAVRGVAAAARTLECVADAPMDHVERLGLDLDYLAPSLFSGLCRLDAEVLLVGVEEQLLLALQGICVWALGLVGHAIGGFKRLSGQVLWEWASGDPVWALLLAKGCLSLSLERSAVSEAVPFPADLGRLQRAILKAVLELASPDVAFSQVVGDSGDISIAARAEALVNHRAELAEAVRTCNFVPTLVLAADREGGEIGPKLAEFFVALLQPELIEACPDWASSSEAARATLQEARDVSARLVVHLPRHVRVIWRLLAAAPAAFAGQLPKGFLQDCASLAYFCQPPEDSLTTFLTSCLVARSYGSDASDDAYVLATLCVLAANAELITGSSVLAHALIGLNSFGQDSVLECWARWKAPVRLVILGQWAAIIINQPALGRPPPEVPPSPPPYAEPAVFPAPVQRGGAVLRDLMREAPAEFRCALDKCLMMDPVQSPYGHVFERSSLARELANSGGYCPITGRLLDFDSCDRLPGIRRRILQWIRSKRPIEREQPKWVAAAASSTAET